MLVATSVSKKKNESLYTFGRSRAAWELHIGITICSTSGNRIVIQTKDWQVASRPCIPSTITSDQRK